MKSNSGSRCLMSGRRGRLLPVMAFFGVLLGLLAADLAGGNREFSENENRCLAGMPKLDGQELLNADFQEKYEKYLSDQFCFRDRWITIRTGILKSCGDTDIGDTYIGRDGYYFEKILPESVDEKLFQRNVRAVRKLFDYEREQGMDPSRIQILAVPTAAGVLRDKLPENARMFDQSRYIAQIREALSNYKVIDGERALTAEVLSAPDEASSAQDKASSASGKASSAPGKASSAPGETSSAPGKASSALSEAYSSSTEAQLYYRTDHHWTGDGVLAVYREWLRSTGRSDVTKNSYKKRTVTEDFKGSMYSRVLDHAAVSDHIWVYEDGQEARAQVMIEGQKRGFYDESKLKEKDKYAYFFGGNHDEVEISNPGGKEGSLLVIKDSFANSFVPMLSGQYKKIYMLDLRYYKGSVREYIREKGVTDILVLYNIANFISDRDIFLMGMR